MEPWLAALIIVGAAALSAVVMLLVRRHAPPGTLFVDPIPAAAVYTVAGTAYMVIVAFVFFIAFENYGGAKSHAEQEATATLAMFHAAGAFGSEARAESEEQAICYAREVITYGWPAMRRGGYDSVVDARVAAMERAAEQVPVSDANQAAVEHWFALNDERRQGRQGRIDEANRLVPPIVWLILILGAVVAIASVCSFADPRERAVTQAGMIAAIAIIVVSGLVLVQFLDNPYEDTSGSIKPTAITRTLALMERDHRERDPAVLRCANLTG